MRARGLLGQLAGVMSGGAVWRRSSYLAGREGTAIASPLVEIVDDPLLRRGPGSRPFDGEGLASRTNVLVSEGLLRDVPVRCLRGAQAGAPVDRIGVARHRRQPARRRHELDPAAGRTPAADLERLDRGLYVTDLMGFGFNAVTGDYSQGAGGFWIESGERAYPVTEITVSRELRRSLEGDRRRRRRPRHAFVGRSPRSFRVANMMIAGS